MSSGSSKLEQPDPFSEVLINAFFYQEKDAQLALRKVEALLCGQPQKRNRLSEILHKSTITASMQQAERELTVFDAPP